jgi:hypothetical protein
MLLEIDKDLKETKIIPPQTINVIGQNEKSLENCITKLIGDVLFPELLVFGNERSFQSEPDIFAVNGKGDLIIFELKVHGQYDRGKTLQAMSYAERYSNWRYNDINAHFQKCINTGISFMEEFEQHYGFRIDESDFNRSQKIIIISHLSSLETAHAVSYWRSHGIDIQEYFYRFYQIEGKLYFELSNELYNPADNRGNCWINTNAKYGRYCYYDMVFHHKVATYGGRMNLIGNWLSKAYIFLYQNGYGIIGAGRGTSKISDTVYSEDAYTDDERNMHLRDFIHGVNMETKEIDTCIPAWKIKHLLERDFWFPNTVVPLSENDAKVLYNECRRVFQSN